MVRSPFWPRSYNARYSKCINIRSVIYQSRCDVHPVIFSMHRQTGSSSYRSRCDALCLLISETDQHYFVININRGATPMRADAAWATPGFSGAAPSGPRSHPRGQARPALRCARLPTASQALSNAALSGARSLPGRLRTPRTPEGVLRGQRPEKPSADRESSKGNAYQD